MLNQKRAKMRKRSMTASNIQFLKQKTKQLDKPQVTGRGDGAKQVLKYIKKRSFKDKEAEIVN